MHRIHFVKLYCQLLSLCVYYLFQLMIEHYFIEEFLLEAEARDIEREIDEKQQIRCLSYCNVIAGEERCFSRKKARYI